MTPYDVFQAYRDQNRRQSRPSSWKSPLKSSWRKFPSRPRRSSRPNSINTKMFFPIRAHKTPGFKVPREIQLEILSIDGNALARGIRDKITEAELRAAYENRKAEFQERSELPNDLFAGQPELTPPSSKAVRRRTKRVGPRLG